MRHLRRELLCLVLLSLVLTSSFFLPAPFLSSSGPLFPSETFTQPSQPQANTVATSDSSRKPGWDFLNPSLWGDFAQVDSDSAQLVVGLSFTGPGTTARLADLATANGGSLVRQVLLGGVVWAVVVDVPLASVGDFASTVQSLGLSRYVEPNFKFFLDLIPNDPLWPQQWGPVKIQAPDAWDIQLGNNSTILVAVVDTGIDYTHPDLQANYVPLGYDWANNDTDPLDDVGHGTHVAGIIAATINNAEGIAGLAQVRIMAEKVFASSGFTTEDILASGLADAADKGAQIINNSWGGSFDSSLIREAIKYAHAGGALVVAAAGNSGSSEKHYPAAYPEVVAVTATAPDDSPAFFTTYGDWVELAAPGVDVLSTVCCFLASLNSSYTDLSGTSMASPHVVGVASLVWSQYPQMSRDQVRLQLRLRSDDLGTPGFDVFYGYGRVNAGKAVLQPPPDHELILVSMEKPSFIRPGTVGVLNATVLNFGLSEETNVIVQWFVNGTQAGSNPIPAMPSGMVASANFTFAPVLEGRYNVTASVVPVPGEADIQNNQLSSTVTVGTPIVVAVLDSAGTDIFIDNWNILNDEWFNFGQQLIFVDYTSLNRENITYEDIRATGADVLALPCACGPDWEFTDSEIEAIRQYTLEGHGLVATAGTLWEGVPNNNKLGPLFGLREDVTWQVTGTDLYDILDRSHPLFRNIPDPYTIPLAPTSVPSDRAWSDNELQGGTYVALGFDPFGLRGASAMVVRRGLVYISTIPEAFPARYFFHLQLLYNAFTWSRYQPPLHDLTVGLKTPRFATPGLTSLINATVLNAGLSEESAEVQLIINGSQTGSSLISLQPLSSTTLSFPTVFSVPGIYNVTATVLPVPGEDDPTDNVVSRFLFVGTPTPVLWDDSHDLDGDSLRGNYRLLDDLLSSRGFFADELSQGPITLQVLSGYSILVLLDPELDFQSSEIVDIRNWLAQGGGLMVIPDAGFPFNTLNNLLAPYGVFITGNPVFAEEVTRNVLPHPITQGVGGIFYSLAWQLSASQPSSAIAYSTFEYWPILTADDVDRVAVISDSNVMDNPRLVMADNSRLMLNMFKWAASRGHDLAVSIDAPAVVSAGQNVTLTATVLNVGGFNETNVLLEFSIDNSTVATSEIAFLGRRESSSLYYLWSPGSGGEFSITARATPVPGEENVDNNVVTVRVLVVAVRDISVTLSAPSIIQLGTTAFALITVTNEGSQTEENVEVQLLAYDLASPGSGSVLVNATLVPTIGPSSSIELSLGWTPQVAGTFLLKANVNPLPGEVDLQDNSSTALVSVTAPVVHDLSVTISGPSTIQVNSTATIQVTVSNQGSQTEVSVMVSLQANGIVVGSSRITSIGVGTSAIISFTWTPNATGSYILAAHIQPVPGETDLANNTSSLTVTVIPPPPDTSARFTNFKARAVPQVVHISKSTVVTLSAIVENTGPNAVYVRVEFLITDSNGTAYRVTSDPVLLQPGESREVSTVWSLPSVMGRYTATAVLYRSYDPTLYPWINTETTKFAWRVAR